MLFSDFFFLYISFFFLLDFSKTPGRIFMKFSGMVYIGLERLKIVNISEHFLNMVAQLGGGLPRLREIGVRFLVATDLSR